MSEKNFNINKKQLIWVVFGFSIFIIFGLILDEIAYTNASIVYGKFTDESSIRGSHSMYYKFYYKNVLKEGGVRKSEIKNIPIDSLKKLDIIKIEVSNYSTFFNRIIDKRVLDE
jgi:hypothetical protein